MKINLSNSILSTTLKVLGALTGLLATAQAQAAAKCEVLTCTYFCSGPNYYTHVKDSRWVYDDGGNAIPLACTPSVTSQGVTCSLTSSSMSEGSNTDCGPK